MRSSSAMHQTPFQPRRLLLTGGAGFIGSNLLHWLFRGNRADDIERVVVLDALTYAGNLMSIEDLLSAHDPKLSFIKGDVADAALVRSLFEQHAFDTVLHLAAESHVDRSIENSERFVHTNVMGTFHVLEESRRAWAQSSGCRFVLISTDEVYGSLGDSGLFTEESPYSPNSPYAASKAGADHLARAWWKTYGHPVIVTNCSNNYGPRQFPEKLIPLMIRNAIRSLPLPVYGEGKQVRDWIHVDDHCAGLWAALTRGTPGERYNLGGEHEMQNIDLVHQLAALVDVEMGRPLGTSAALIRFVADRPGHDHRYALDTAKAHRDLAWSPQISFESGLKSTVNWYISNADWVEATISGEYRRFYDQHYLGRLQRAGMSLMSDQEERGR